MILGADHICTVQKRYKKQQLTYTGSTGTPVFGQTVTGGTSHKTAVIDRLGSGLIVVKTLSGNFTPTETITIGTSPVPGYTFSATLSAQADYEKSAGSYDYYWTTDQSNVVCRFYQGGGRGVIILTPGATVDQPLRCALPTSVNITQMTAMDYRIVTTETQFAGTYSIQNFFPKSGMAVRIDHFEATLKVVN